MKLPVPLQFDWDKGNIAKSQLKHQVSPKETKEVFFNQPLKTFKDKVHSEKENRFVALGVTDSQRSLFIIFIIRKAKIRVISSRDQSRKKGLYMANVKNKLLPKFKTEDAERKFWATHDFADYANQFEEVQLDLSKLKPSTESISLRLPASLLARVRQIANSRAVPYQSLMKVFLAERVEKEMAGVR